MLQNKQLQNLSESIHQRFISHPIYVWNWLAILFNVISLCNLDWGAITHLEHCWSLQQEERRVSCWHLNTLAQKWQTLLLFTTQRPELITQPHPTTKKAGGVIQLCSLLKERSADIGSHFNHYPKAQDRFCINMLLQRWQNLESPWKEYREKIIRCKRRTKKVGVMNDQEEGKRVNNEVSYQCRSFLYNSVLCTVRQGHLTRRPAGCPKRGTSRHHTFPW